MTRQHVPQAGRSGPMVMWAAMQRLTRKRGSFTVAEIARAASDAAPNTVSCYVAACRRADYVEVVGMRPVTTAKSHGRENLYAVKVNRREAPFEKSRAPSEHIPRPGTVQLQIWTAMRAMTSWTAKELALAASTDEVVVAEPVARKYSAALRKAGYVQVVEPPRSSRSHGRYRLKPSGNTGPLPPLLRENGTVVDRNRVSGAAR